MTATMTTPSTTIDSVADLSAFAQQRAGTPGPDWLRALRQRAAAQFGEHGLPTTKHEEWRFTNIRPITQTPFVPAEEAPASVSCGDVARYQFEEFDASLLVFVNGQYEDKLSDPPTGVTVCPLSEAIASHEDILRPQLERIAGKDNDGFARLNTAAMEDGVFIHVKKGQAVQHPIRLLHIASPGKPFMSHPRNVIVAEQGADVTVIERYVTLGEGAYFTNAVTQIEAGDNAHVAHYLLEQESNQAFNVNTLHIHQGRDTRVESHSVLLGGALVRNNIWPVLDGENGDCLINGLYIGHGSQHLDNFMHVEHAKPNCESRQFYKGILDDKSHGVFRGRIVVHQEAQQTDAKQTNANLLLSDSAEIDTKPQLEIYADDVKCTHGATIGQINEDAIFYLRSRGIHKDDARAMMVFAFAGESLDRMSVAPIREALTRELVRQLPSGKFVESML